MVRKIYEKKTNLIAPQALPIQPLVTTVQLRQPNYPSHLVMEASPASWTISFVPLGIERLNNMVRLMEAIFA
jgi:hypothetical protein